MLFFFFFLFSPVENINFDLRGGGVCYCLGVDGPSKERVGYSYMYLVATR